MTYALGARSLARLDGVHPDLVRVIKLAISLSPIDFAVIEGLRTDARQAELYAQGRTKPGPKVTWTLASRHKRQPSGYGEAVDLAPFIAGAIDWTAGKNFDAIADAMFKAADQLGVKLRWGADWNQNGKPRERGESDSPHWELTA